MTSKESTFATSSCYLSDHDHAYGDDVYENDEGEDLEDLLVNACYRGDVTCLSLHVPQLSDVHTKDSSFSEAGSSLLWLCARYGHFDCVKLIANAHHNLIRIANVNGSTPLHVACQEGHEKVAVFLLDLDVGLARIRNKDGETPLHSASMNGHVAIALLLIDRDPHVIHMGRHHDDRTAFHLACQYSELAVAGLLLEKSPDVMGISDAMGLHPLSIVCESSSSLNHHQYLPVISLMVVMMTNELQRIRSDPSEKEKFIKQLSEACKRGDDIVQADELMDFDRARHFVWEIEQQLRAHRERLQQTCCSRRDSPWMMACQHAFPSILSQYINWFPELLTIDHKFSDGKTPLHMAVEKESLATVALLTTMNSEWMKIRDNDGNTPFSLACSRGLQHIASFMIQIDHSVAPAFDNVGAILDSHGSWSSLHLACANGHHDTVRLLLDTLPNCVDDAMRMHVIMRQGDLFTPLYLACYNGHHEVVSVLMKNHACAWMARHGLIPLTPPVHGGDTGIGVISPPSACALSDSPLHTACAQGNQIIVSLIIEKDPDLVNFTNAEGFTPLDMASRHWRINIAKYLLFLFPSVENLNRALSAAAKSSCSFHQCATTDSGRATGIGMLDIVGGRYICRFREQEIFQNTISQLRVVDWQRQVGLQDEYYYVQQVLLVLMSVDPSYTSVTARQEKQQQQNPHDLVDDTDNFASLSLGLVTLVLRGEVLQHTKREFVLFQQHIAGLSQCNRSLEWHAKRWRRMLKEN